MVEPSKEEHLRTEEEIKRINEGEEVEKISKDPSKKKKKKKKKAQKTEAQKKEQGTGSGDSQSHGHNHSHGASQSKVARAEEEAYSNQLTKLLNESNAILNMEPNFFNYEKYSNLIKEKIDGIQKILDRVNNNNFEEIPDEKIEEGNKADRKPTPKTEKKAKYKTAKIFLFYPKFIYFF